MTTADMSGSDEDEPTRAQEASIIDWPVSHPWHDPDLPMTRCDAPSTTLPTGKVHTAIRRSDDLDALRRHIWFFPGLYERKLIAAMAGIIPAGKVKAMLHAGPDQGWLVIEKTPGGNEHYLIEDAAGREAYLRVRVAEAVDLLLEADAAGLVDDIQRQRLSGGGRR